MIPGRLTTATAAITATSTIDLPLSGNPFDCYYRYSYFDPYCFAHLTFGPAYSVQLVGSEVILPAHDSSGLKDILQPNEATNSIIIKRKITSIASTPVKIRNEKLNIEKAVSAIRQNQREKQKTSAVSSAASGAKMSESEVNAQTNEYIGFVWSRVKKTGRCLRH